eukprot:15440282-Alexandrium_andersonii.AAC.1
MQGYTRAHKQTRAQVTRKNTQASKLASDDDWRSKPGRSQAPRIAITHEQTRAVLRRRMVGNCQGLRSFANDAVVHRRFRGMVI